MNKRGLSQIVTTLIVIMLSLVAIAILWVVVANFLRTGSEQISSGEISKYTIDLEMNRQSIMLNPDNTLTINVKRNIGAGKVDGIRFILSDGASTYSVDNYTAIKELEEKTFKIPIGNLTYVKDISVAFISLSDSGKPSYSNVFAKYSLTNEQVLSSLKNANGLVSWYRFDGNANDEKGVYNGTCSICPVYVSGKKGQAVYFDGRVSRSIITIDDNGNLQSPEFTISFWINKNSTNGVNGEWDAPFGNSAYTTHYSAGWNGRFRNLSLLRDYLGFYLGRTDTGTSISIYSEEGIWNYISFTYNTSTLSVYKNGLFNKSVIFAGGYTQGTNDLLFGRDYVNLAATYYNGTIDEFMVFNKTLSAEQINSLYQAVS